MAKKPMLRIEIYEGQGMPPGGGWYFRLTNTRNKKVVADGSEAYNTRGNALRAVHRLLDLIEAGDYEVVGDASK